MNVCLRADTKMKIYDFPLAFNPPKAKLAAAEKGVKYDRVTLNIFTADNVKPDFLKISQAGTLPCLVDGDKVIPSSKKIVEYLDQMDGKPLGSPAVDQSAVASWMDKIDAWDGNLFAFANASPSVKSILESASWYKERAITTYRAKHPELKDVYDQRLAAMKASAAEASDASAIEKNAEQLSALLQEAEAQLAKQPYLAGSEYSAADVLFTPVLYRIHDLSRQGVYLSDKPHVVDYWKKVKQRPSFKEVYGPAENPLTLLQLVAGGLARITLCKVTGL